MVIRLGVLAISTYDLCNPSMRGTGCSGPEEVGIEYRIYSWKRGSSEESVIDKYWRGNLSFFSDRVSVPKHVNKVRSQYDEL
jgi:hypothetical protein